MIGQTLSHFKITAKLGEGGMGEVYRAEDTALDRDVAIKILPEALTEDPERLARFEREAKVLASLNHPNIAGIHQIEKADGRQLLVMELVEGEDLADRMGRGTIPIEDAVDIAGQVAEGLQAAHERGIVHRDLKPANIKLTPDGQVKILDFGLAKAQEATEASPDLTRSPTLTAQMTQAGVILGTAAYMSPEQARGQEADPRSDLWALGVVLWEMLAGRQLFAEPTVSDTLAAVLRAEIDLKEQQGNKYPMLDRVLVRCLQRDPRQRYHSAVDLRLDLEDALQRRHEPTADESLVTASPMAARRYISWLALALVVASAVLVGVAIGRFGVPPAERAPEPTVARLDLPVPSDRPVATGSFLNPLAVSPDGRTLVYVGVEQGTRRLYRRPLDQLAAEPIPGTEDAEGPFFSPDGEEVAFWAQGRVQRVSLAGGLPRPVFTSSDFRGGVWAPDGTIIASPSQQGPLCRVSATGGKCMPLTTDGPGFQHRLPSLLPDGRVLFGMRTGDRFAYDNAGLAVLSLDTGEVRAVADGVGIDGRYAAGHLFYVQANSLIARPFDLERLEFTGPARTVQQGVQVQSNTGAGQFVLTPDGSLAFLPGEAIGDDTALARVDRDGSSEYLSTERDVFRWPVLTPDASQLTVVIISEERGGRWITRLDTPGLTRMPPGSAWPAWAPDGRHMAVRSNEDVVPQELYYVDAFQSTERATLFTASPEVRDVQPTSISPDGRYLLFGMALAIDNHDVYALEIDDPSSARPFLQTESIECGARFSSDGRWVAYVSNATGRFEVYVTDWPANRLQRQVSTSGGREPLWSSEGGELFYRSGERMMAAQVRFEQALEVETPQVLFTGDYEGMLGKPDSPNYAVAPDGRFLMLRSADLASTADRIALVRNALDARPLRAGVP